MRAPSLLKKVSTQVRHRVRARVVWIGWRYGLDFARALDQLLFAEMKQHVDGRDAERDAVEGEAGWIWQEAYALERSVLSVDVGCRCWV